MADTYTSSLRFQLQGIGYNLNTWGTILNSQLQLIEAAICGDNGYAGGAGGISLAGLVAYSLTVVQGQADQARALLYPFVGALTADCVVTIPGVVKIGYALNATTGGHNVVLKVSSGGGSLTLAPGSGWTLFYCDGTNVTSPATSSTSLTTNGTDAGGASLRLIGGTVGTILRNDGSNFYLLFTPPGSSGGGYNGLRPLQVNVTTGQMVFDGTAAGVSFGGAVTVDGALVVDGAATVKGAINVAGLATVGSVYANTSLGGLQGYGPYLSPSGGVLQSTSWGFQIAVATGSGLGMAAAGFFCVSDARLKDDIEDIQPDDAIAWVMCGRARTYTMEGKPCAGFIAQEDVVAGRGAAVALLDDEDPRVAEGDGFAPDGKRFARDYTHDIAYLTAALQVALKRIVALEAREG